MYVYGKSSKVFKYDRIFKRVITELLKRNSAVLINLLILWLLVKAFTMQLQCGVADAANNLMRHIADAPATSFFLIAACFSCCCGAPGWTLYGTRSYPDMRTINTVFHRDKLAMFHSPSGNSLSRPIEHGTSILRPRDVDSGHQAALL